MCSASSVCRHGAIVWSAPVASGEEGSPVERKRALTARQARLEHRHTGVTNGVGRAGALLKALPVERAHPGSRRLVLNRPQANDDGAHAGDLKRALQAE